MGAIVQAHPLFGVDSTPVTIDNVSVSVASLDKACSINNMFHSSLPNASPGNMQVYPSVAFLIHTGGNIIGSAIWSRPTARMLNARKWIELRRMALSVAAPKNTASKSISLMLKEIKAMFPDITKAISYQDISRHEGTIYKASNWHPVLLSKVNPSAWLNRKDRSEKGVAHKIRWEYDL